MGWGEREDPEVLTQLLVKQGGAGTKPSRTQPGMLLLDSRVSGLGIPTEHVSDLHLLLLLREPWHLLGYRQMDAQRWDAPGALASSARAPCGFDGQDWPSHTFPEHASMQTRKGESHRGLGQRRLAALCEPGSVPPSCLCRGSFWLAQGFYWAPQKTRLPPPTARGWLVQHRPPSRRWREGKHDSPSSLALSPRNTVMARGLSLQVCLKRVPQSSTCHKTWEGRSSRPTVEGGADRGRGQTWDAAGEVGSCPTGCTLPFQESTDVVLALVRRL
ncbi:UNVERIFIED_CONTAM: hypothetical protein K2H54_064088 [Gekko kuhli]